MLIRETNLLGKVLRKLIIKINNENYTHANILRHIRRNINLDLFYL